MNCLDYRRLLLSGEDESVPMKAHRTQCAACAELLAEHEEFERALKREIAIAVPEGLEARLSSGLALRRRRFLAAAAVSALAVGGGAYAWLWRGDPLAMACIDFVMKEEAKSIMMGAMPRAEAEAAIGATVPLARLERVGQLRHIGPCPFNGATAYHVVLAVPQGKVTLLVMPSSPGLGQRTAAKEGLHATVVTMGSGSIGIVGSDAGVVDSVAGALRAASPA